jgi:hypothetical protein
MFFLGIFSCRVCQTQEKNNKFHYTSLIEENEKNLLKEQRAEVQREVKKERKRERRGGRQEKIGLMLRCLRPESLKTLCPVCV